MRTERADVYGIVASTILCSTPIAYICFEFVLPNVSFPSFSSNLLVVLVLSVLTGIPAGYMNKRADFAIISVITYTALGYALAFTFYSVPFMFYHVQQVIPDLYYALFLRLTITLLFVFVVGGIMGMTAGQIIRDSIRRQETRLLWREEPKP
jgi:hypothetical protein